jgi:lipoprotein-anchoring transpeptidase ErfK/SrfK
VSPIKVTRISFLAIAAVFALSAPAAAPPAPAATTAPAPAPVTLVPVALSTPAQWDLASQTELSDQGNSLRPGDYRQLAEFQPSAPVTVVVDIPSQLAGVYQQNQLVVITTVSTGKPGHETPVGTFRVTGKAVDHHSNLYNNAPMPYMQRLTNDGVSIHAGKITGVPSSHGCVRMPLGMAKLLYGATKIGTEVTIIDRPAPPVGIETAGLGRDSRVSSPAG